LSKELFCPVCLDVFVDPVETDCGHYFCSVERCKSPIPFETAQRCSCTQAFAKGPKLHYRQYIDLGGLLLTLHGIEKITDGRAKQVQDKQRNKTFHFKSNTRDAERKIKEFYRKLRTILEEEEVSLLEKLRKEEADGTKKLKKKLQNLPEEIYSMERRIIEIEKDLAQQDHFTFLQVILALLSVKLEPFKEEILSVELETHKYLGPQLFYTWKKKISLSLKQKSPRLPAALTFDRETAAPNVQVTGDNRRAVKRHFSGKVPDSPQRFGQDAVLAAEGFTAGAHYWEAEVEVLHDMQQIKDTLLGVACTSVQRKGDSPCNPENGFWVCPVGKLVELWQRRRTAEVSEKRKFTVGVYLNYEEGTVSFYDADAMSHVHTISGEFTEKVYPYFKLVHAMRFHCFNFYVSVT
uniref:B30.2/SPRY domain-containing protein n=1 Tax=Latimeria chalumnae TaxID=7897 RepID=H3A645_LATCH